MATNCFYSIFLQCATGLFKQTFCYPTRWTPPAILRSYVGEKVASRSDGIPLSDEQIEVGAFCWTDLPLDIVNPEREERVSIQLKTSWGVLPPRELWGLTWPYLIPSINVGTQINLLVLDRTPESFKQDIVDAAPSFRPTNPDAFSP